MQNSSERTFSCISDVLCASQKATVATSFSIGISTEQSRPSSSATNGLGPITIGVRVSIRGRFGCIAEFLSDIRVIFTDSFRTWKKMKFSFVRFWFDSLSDTPFHSSVSVYFSNIIYLTQYVYLTFKYADWFTDFHQIMIIIITRIEKKINYFNVTAQSISMLFFLLFRRATFAISLFQLISSSNARGIQFI